MENIEEPRSVAITKFNSGCEPTEIARFFLERVEKRSRLELVIFSMKVLKLSLYDLMPLGGWHEVGGPLDDDQVNEFLKPAFEKAMIKLTESENLRDSREKT